MSTNRILAMVGSAVVLVASGSIHDALAGINAGGRPGSSSGTVTQFGSIYVNGVRFNTDRTVFLIDGELGRESDLKVGQVVTVFGSVDAGGTSGVADLVIYEDAVKGPVSAVQPGHNQLTILGQTVLVGNDTSFSVRPGVDSIDDLRGDEVVEVSGYMNAEGAVVATHISSASGDEFDVTGVVTAVAGGSYRLTIGGLEIDYSGANLQGLAGGMPQVGQRIEVTGTHLNASGEFVAAWIENGARAISAGAGDAAEIEGLITVYSSPWNFEVDGVPVSINWGTQFEGGWLFHLGPNAKVEIEGQFDSQGRLIADSVEFESASSFHVVGLVESVDGNTIIVDGVAMHLSTETEYEDDSDVDERRFGIDDLRTGDYVRVWSYSDDGEAIVTRLERHDDDDGEDDDDNSDSDD